jgi:hypothetical protein
MPHEIETTTTPSTTTHPLWNADKAYGLAFFRGQAPCGECDLGVRRGATCGTCDGSGLHPGVERFTLGEHADYVRTELRNALAVVADFVARLQVAEDGTSASREALPAPWAPVWRRLDNLGASVAAVVAFVEEVTDDVDGDAAQTITEER